MYLITCFVCMLCSMHLIQGESDDQEQDFVTEVIRHHNHRGLGNETELPEISLYDFKTGVLDTIEDLTLFYNQNLSDVNHLLHLSDSSSTSNRGAVEDVLSSFVCNRKERQFTTIKNNKAEVCCTNLVGKSRGCNKYDCNKGSRRRLRDSSRSTCCQSGGSTFCPGTTKASAERSNPFPLSCDKSKRFHDIDAQRGTMRFCCTGGSCSNRFFCLNVVKKTHRTTNRFFFCCQAAIPGGGSALSMFCQNQASPQPAPSPDYTDYVPPPTNGPKKPYGGNYAGRPNCPYTRAQVLNQFERMTTTFKEISSEVKKQNEERGNPEDAEQKAALSRFLATVPNQIMQTLAVFSQSAGRLGR